MNDEDVLLSVLVVTAVLLVFFAGFHQLWATNRTDPSSWFYSGPADPDPRQVLPAPH